MAQKALREFDGKAMVSRLLPNYVPGGISQAASLGITLSNTFLQVAMPEGGSSMVDFNALAASAPWVLTSQLVVKPDQLIKRRGKGGLLGLNLNWTQVQEWISERMGKDVTVDNVTGRLTHFLVEPFLPHPQSDEYYVCINSHRAGEDILFYHAGGVDIGDVDSKAVRLFVPIGDPIDIVQVKSTLLTAIPESRRDLVATFITALFTMYMDAQFAYLEINPLVVTGDIHTPNSKATASTIPRLVPLDMAAKIDEAGAFLAESKWGDITFPPPFGRLPEPEEAYIRELDGKTGASLKLTILNRKGLVWTMVAGGGASVAYADTISDMGYGHELANYGEYSGAPSEGQTYEYARTILKMIGGHKRNEGKILIIGGGIANFTDVAKTFSGIIKALREAASMLIEHKVTIWVRRGGPNYQEGLRLMRELGHDIGVPIHVYGPDTHITAIVALALGKPEALEGLKVSEEGAHHLTSTSITSSDQASKRARVDTRSDLRLNLPGEGTGAKAVSHPSMASNISSSSSSSGMEIEQPGTPQPELLTNITSLNSLTGAPWWGANAFNPSTRCIVYGMQQRAVQGMLDFDYLCKRSKPSVAAMVYPFSGNHYLKFYWGQGEIMMPVYASTEEALRRHSDVTVFVNFASFRSVYPSTMEVLNHTTKANITSIAIIAEGVPEQQTRLLIREAQKKNVMLIGPATVGGVTAGCFRIGNTGGMLDNIVSCRLYRPGSVGYVSKSGGMSNELNNIMAQYTDGICEGVAIGGDRYPGSLFIDHLLRYQANPRIKMMVLLGEVGGIDEYEVAAAIKDGRITKPVVAWCIGTCARIFPFEVQFGHAGALAGSAAQTAEAKNSALKAAGAIVPSNFNDFVVQIAKTYERLVGNGTIVAMTEPPAPTVPMDYAWAKSLGLIRKPAAFVSSISDDRGEELLYAGIPISKVFEENLGIGGVIALLWFRRRLPSYAARFIEMTLMVAADHGPAVSGAHNTIVTARAGKDLISALCSGLLTIGPRFGGALDDAALQFSGAYDSRTAPATFVKDMRNANKLIMGIGHKVKSILNPDKRVTILRDFALQNFPSTDVLNYALEVEKITTAKRENLILNVDGLIAVAFVDLIRGCGAFTREEADETLASGFLNGLFVVARSIGFIGHYLDQKRLKQDLYRHPTDDITYMESLA